MTQRILAFLLIACTSLFTACGGGSSSSTATTTATAPTITAQPASVSATAGGTASFSVTATGTATLSYQWRKAGTAITGATSSSYALSALTTSDAGSYDVVVSNAAGSVTSAAATLTVTSSTGAVAPALTTQPVSQAVAAGSSVSLSVVASGTAPLSYQWAKDGSAISNATAASYTIAAAATGDAGSYTVTVSNGAGSVTSSAATLTVSNATGSSALSATVTTAAQAFYATLSATQQAGIQLSWDLAAGRKWSNLPASMSARNGLSLGSLSTSQRTAANSLIAAALSTSGNTLWTGMLAADDYLAANGGGNSYGNGNYYIAFLGAPSSSGFWVLQLTGHHLTYNIAFNGTVKTPTPLFLGVEPKGAFTQGGSSYDPMLAQRTAAADLGTTLTGYPAAQLSGTYADLMFGANGSGGIDGSYPKAYPSSGRGVLFTALSTTDQEKVKTFIRAYVNTQATEYAADLLASYLSDTSLAQTYVAYAGAGNVTSSGSYFRVDGPRLWLEFSVQRGIIFNSDIHFHTIWRDKTGDFGGRCCS